MSLNFYFEHVLLVSFRFFVLFTFLFILALRNSIEPAILCQLEKWVVYSVLIKTLDIQSTLGWHHFPRFFSLHELSTIWTIKDRNQIFLFFSFFLPWIVIGLQVLYRNAVYPILSGFSSLDDSLPRQRGRTGLCLLSDS